MAATPEGSGDVLSIIVSVIVDGPVCSAVPLGSLVSVTVTVTGGAHWLREISIHPRTWAHRLGTAALE